MLPAQPSLLRLQHWTQLLWKDNRAHHFTRNLSYIFCCIFPGGKDFMLFYSFFTSLNVYEGPTSSVQEIIMERLMGGLHYIKLIDIIIT